MTVLNVALEATVLGTAAAIGGGALVGFATSRLPTPLLRAPWSRATSTEPDAAMPASSEAADFERATASTPPDNEQPSPTPAIVPVIGHAKAASNQDGSHRGDDACDERCIGNAHVDHDHAAAVRVPQEHRQRFESILAGAVSTIDQSAEPVQRARRTEYFKRAAAAAVDDIEDVFRAKDRTP